MAEAVAISGYFAELEHGDALERLEALRKLARTDMDITTHVRHADAVVTRLQDADWRVRMLALEVLGKLAPAALAQHAGAVVARLDDDSEVLVCREALRTLG